MDETTRSVLLCVTVLLLSACGSNEKPPAASTPDASPKGPVANACPADGCRIKIVGAERGAAELSITWEANFRPDVSRNHIHVYWDIYKAEQVSDDAASRGVTPGDWTVTDAYPTFVTQSAASVANRGTSTKLCVTAADRDHIVLDASLVDCRDVADLLAR